MSNTVLVFSTWIDEVPLPAGGLMANHAAAGDRVIAVAACYPGHPSAIVFPEVSAELPFGRFKTQENFERSVMRQEVSGVTEALGIEKVITWDFAPLTGATFTDDAVARVAATLNEYQPDIVITHWPISDYSDFIGITGSVMRALIDKRLTKMPQVYFSETLTGRHTLCFVPNIYVDITDTIQRKKAACEKLWEGKVVDYFFNPFALPIARFRGRECGVAYAEAYVALHGSFGIEKQPGRTPVPAGAHPMTMNRTVTCLKRRAFAEGVVPRSYGNDGIIDDETAKKAFGV